MGLLCLHHGNSVSHGGLTLNTARPRSDLTIEKIDGDLVLLDKDLEQIHQLNATACVVWELLTEGSSRSTIADRLHSEFDAPKETILLDIDRIVENFESLGLLENTDA